MAMKKTAAKVRELRPGSAPSDKLDRLLGRIRQLAGEGESTQVSMMEALMELYEHKEVWGERYDFWDTLLREEGFCTPHRYEHFAKAYGEFGKTEVRRIGVGAATLLIQQKASVRTKVIVQLNEWMKTHPVSPTYQRVATEVKKVIGGIVGAKRKGSASKDEQIVTLRATKRDLTKQNKSLTDLNTKLKQHVWRLNSLLKKKGVEPPKMPELPAE